MGDWREVGVGDWREVGVGDWREVGVGDWREVCVCVGGELKRGVGEGWREVWGGDGERCGGLKRGVGRGPERGGD